LGAELAYWSKQADGTKPSDRAQAQRTLRHWRQDTDLAGLRNPEALKKLPAEEREACAKLWADVADLLKHTEEKPKQPR
jgi:hypothetical protein